MSKSTNLQSIHVFLLNKVPTEEIISKNLVISVTMPLVNSHCIKSLSIVSSFPPCNCNSISSNETFEKDLYFRATLIKLEDQLRVSLIFSLYTYKKVLRSLKLPFPHMLSYWNIYHSPFPCHFYILHFSFQTTDRKLESQDSDIFISPL